MALVLGPAFTTTKSICISTSFASVKIILYFRVQLLERTAWKNRFLCGPFKWTALQNGPIFAGRPLKWTTRKNTPLFSLSLARFKFFTSSLFLSFYFRSPLSLSLLSSPLLRSGRRAGAVAGGRWGGVAAADPATVMGEGRPGDGDRSG